MPSFFDRSGRENRNTKGEVSICGHLSGDPTSSREDAEITRRLKEVGELMGGRVLDHIIIGDGGFASFVARGML